MVMSDTNYIEPEYDEEEYDYDVCDDYNYDHDLKYIDIDATRSKIVDFLLPDTRYKFIFRDISARVLTLLLIAKFRYISPRQLYKMEFVSKDYNTILSMLEKIKKDGFISRKPLCRGIDTSTYTITNKGIKYIIEKFGNEVLERRGFDLGFLRKEDTEAQLPHKTSVLDSCYSFLSQGKLKSYELEVQIHKFYKMENMKKNLVLRCDASVENNRCFYIEQDMGTQRYQLLINKIAAYMKADDHWTYKKDKAIIVFSVNNYGNVISRNQGKTMYDKLTLFVKECKKEFEDNTTINIIESYYNYRYKGRDAKKALKTIFIIKNQYPHIKTLKDVDILRKELRREYPINVLINREHELECKARERRKAFVEELLKNYSNTMLDTNEQSIANYLTKGRQVLMMSNNKIWSHLKHFDSVDKAILNYFKSDPYYTTLELNYAHSKLLYWKDNETILFVKNYVTLGNGKVFMFEDISFSIDVFYRIILFLKYAPYDRNSNMNFVFLYDNKSDTEFFKKMVLSKILIMNKDEGSIQSWSNNLYCLSYDDLTNGRRFVLMEKALKKRLK